MKLKFIIPIIVALLGLSATSFSQGISTKAPSSQIPDVSPAGCPDDPKLSEDQKAGILKAGESNPSRPASVFNDPKIKPEDLPDEKACGETNAKPPKVAEETILEENRHRDKKAGKQTENIAVTSTLPPGDNNSQPRNEAPKDVTDYRKINAGNNQPQPALNVTVINFRDIKGSNEQPAGADPGKK
jgi:hypothetical protein